MDPWEIVLYIMALSFSLEGVSVHASTILCATNIFFQNFLKSDAMTSAVRRAIDGRQVYTTIRLFTWRALGFWNVISAITNSLLIGAFGLRVIGIKTSSAQQSHNYHLISFQVLSFVSPFIW